MVCFKTTLYCRGDSSSPNPSRRDVRRATLQIPFIEAAIAQAYENLVANSNLPQQHKQTYDSTSTTSKHQYQAPYVQPGDVIEFCGPSCCGKSAFLYTLIHTTVLPQFWVRDGGKSLEEEERQFYIGGDDNAVILIDLDGRCDTQRIYALIAGYLREKVARAREDVEECDRKRRNLDDVGDAGQEREGNSVGDETRKLTSFDQEYYWLPTEEEIDIIVRVAMQRVHVFQPNSSLEFLATLRSLQDYILESGEEFKYLMIDSIMAFYWQDKSEENTGGSGIRVYDNNNNRQVITSFSAQIVQTLREIISETGVVLVATNWELMHSNSNYTNNSTAVLLPSLEQLLYHKDISPIVWQNFVKYRFVIARLPVDQYPFDIHPIDILKNQQQQNFTMTAIGSNNVIYCGRMVTPNYGG